MGGGVMSTIKANQWLNIDGTENYKCRAWVNFNGTGTVAIRASGNVSSITDNGTGYYTINFSTAMPDANYGISFATGAIYGSTWGGITNFNLAGTYATETAPVTTSFTMTHLNGAGALTDNKYLYVSVFR